MCNQTVSLVAAAIEDRGIPTVTIQLLEEIARKIGPPRALCVPFAHGFPLGQLIDRTDLSPPHLSHHSSGSQKPEGRK